MADNLPNIGLERLRIELNLAEMQLSMKRMAVRKAELDDEMGRIQTNEEATEKAIAELKIRLSAFQKAKE